MKNRILNLINSAGWILPIMAVLMFGACKKNNYLGYKPGTGAPTIASVHTWGKTDSTVRYDTVISYDAQGNPSSTLKQKPYPINPFDSVTTAGYVGNYYLIEGSNLGDAISVTFNGVAAFLNRAWNTDNSILIAIPGNAPAVGPLAIDNLTVTTTHGKVSFKFHIIPPPPNVSSFSPTTASPGGQLVIKGSHFLGLDSVNFGKVRATVLSFNDTTITVTIPSGITATSTIFVSSTYGTGKSSTLFNLFQFKVNVYLGTFSPGWFMNPYTGTGSYTTDPANIEPGSGDSAIQMSYSGAFGGFQFSANTPINVSTAGITQLKISILGAGQMAGTKIQFICNSVYDNTKEFVTNLPASGYADLTIPLSSFGNPATISQITIQNYGYFTTGTSILYIGSIGFN